MHFERTEMTGDESFAVNAAGTRLSRYVFETVRKDDEFILYRGTLAGERAILALAPGSEHPPPATIRKLEHAYSLSAELNVEWAIRPIALTQHNGRTMLILEDPGGEPLDTVLGTPMELIQFLRVGAGLSSALAKLHGRGLIHKDIKPANVLVRYPTGRVWLTGFGIASQLPRERQSPEPPEFTLAQNVAFSFCRAAESFRFRPKRPQPPVPSRFVSPRRPWRRPRFRNPFCDMPPAHRKA